MAWFFTCWNDEGLVNQPAFEEGSSGTVRVFIVLPSRRVGRRQLSMVHHKYVYGNLRKGRSRVRWFFYIDLRNDSPWHVKIYKSYVIDFTVR